MPFHHPVCLKTVHGTGGHGLTGYQKREGRSFHVCFIQTILWQQKPGFITPAAMTFSHKEERDSLPENLSTLKKSPLSQLRHLLANVTIRREKSDQDSHHKVQIQKVHPQISLPSLALQLLATQKVSLLLSAAIICQTSLSPPQYQVINGSNQLHISYKYNGIIKKKEKKKRYSCFSQ